MNTVMMDEEMMAKVGECKPGETKKLMMTVKFGEKGKHELMDVGYHEEGKEMPMKKKGKHRAPIAKAMEDYD